MQCRVEIAGPIDVGANTRGPWQRGRRRHSEPRLCTSMGPERSDAARHAQSRKDPLPLSARPPHGLPLHGLTELAGQVSPP
jgi:hypothetical protein